MRTHIILFSLFISASISAQKSMTVHMKDGSVVKYEMKDVDFVEIEGDETSSTDLPNAATVPTPLDLGLSVEWADHNLGASCASEVGQRYSHDEATKAIESLEDTWRLPTREEWQELYAKCTWEWVTRDGIGGRLITGPNGNSIFLPASGISIDGQNHETGALAIYWTSDQSASNALAAYFDSANIYQMEFHSNSLFSVRMVRSK